MSSTNTFSFLAGGAIVAAAAALLLRKQASSSAAANPAPPVSSAPSKSTKKSMAGKTVVITGASSGIGRAVAKAFHEQGANVAVGARRLERLEALCLELDPSANGTALPIQTDVTDAKSVKNLVNKAEETFGRGVDVMVNVAGVMYFTLMKNCKEDEWNRTVDVNCKGVLNGFGAVLEGMVERGNGHIITISSDAGRRVFKSLAVYCASKYFVEALSEATRRELVGTGLRITTIQPGDCATELVKNNTDTEALDSMGIQAGAVVGEGWGNEWNLLRPEDVAASVLYAATAPAHVAVNEVLIEPRDQE
jgi:NADP-dependent 3-hydroxy acid dehydrogenase YdfG